MRFRSHLIKLALESPHRRYQHAALVARGKVIVGEGINIHDQHAEARALWEPRNALCKGLANGATLYTLMVKRSTGELGDGTPCKECMEAITTAGIRKVVVYL